MWCFTGIYKLLYTVDIVKMYSSWQVRLIKITVCHPTKAETNKLSLECRKSSRRRKQDLLRHPCLIAYFS